MKKLKYIINLILIYMIFPFQSVSNAQDNTVLNFFPVENLKIITPYTCKVGDKIVWQEKFETTLNGIKPKIKINTFSDSGNIVEAKVENPICFKGACGANYIALPLTSFMPLNEVIAVSKNKEIHIVNLAIDKKFHSCKNVVLPKKDPYNFGFKTVPPRCKYFSWKSNNANNFAELVSFGWKQGNGRDVYQQYFRIISKKDGKIIDFGDIQLLNYSTDEFKPYFGFYQEDKKIKLLWGQYNGIGPVSEIIFKESYFDKNGKIIWLNEYKAGGQPCD